MLFLLSQTAGPFAPGALRPLRLEQAFPLVLGFHRGPECGTAQAGPLQRGCRQEKPVLARRATSAESHLRGCSSGERLGSWLPSPGAGAEGFTPAVWAAFIQGSGMFSAPDVHAPASPWSQVQVLCLQRAWDLASGSPGWQRSGLALHGSRSHSHSRATRDGAVRGARSSTRSLCSRSCL